MRAITFALAGLIAVVGVAWLACGTPGSAYASAPKAALTATGKFADRLPQGVRAPAKPIR